MGFAETGIPESEADADILLAQIEGEGLPEAPPEQGEPQPVNASTGKPMEAPPGEVEKQGEVEAAANELAELAIKWNGKEITLPKDKVIAYAQQGYDYNEKMRDLNVQRSSFERDRGQWEKENQALQKDLELYKEFDAYNKQNPQWWEHVKNSYQAAKEGGEQSDQLASLLNHPVVSQLQSTVREVSSKLESFEEQAQRELEAKEDQALDQEIREYRESYRDIDWEQKDEMGRTLEKQILDHANQYGINKWSAAANDYLLEKHLERARLQAKEEVGKEIKRAHKTGKAQVATQPKDRFTQTSQVRDKDYSDLISEAEAELGIR